MSKTITFAEAVASMKAKEGKNGKPIINRFNKKNFATLMTGMANDLTLTSDIVKVKNGDIESVEKVLVTEGFRQFCKKIIEKAGVDKKESAVVLTSDFEFNIADFNGFYEFIEYAIYKYMELGNQFDFQPREDFKGSISLKDVDEVTKTAEAFSPKDRSSLGVYKTTKKKHKELAVKSSCPSYLKNRIKVQ